VGVAALAFLAVVLALRYAVFPQIDSYREDIAASISRASGMQVRIGDIDAGWQGLRPALTLTAIRVAERGGSPVFELDRAEISLSWWTLFAGDLRFHDVDFFNPVLRLRRGPDGLIYLADKPLNAGAGDDGAFVSWMLAQPRLAIHGATLAWEDEFAGAPAVELRRVEIAIRKEGRRHRAALVAVPPPAIADRIDVRADLQFSRPGGQWQASGTLYAETRRADLARLHAHLPIPESLRTATGAFRAWLEVEPGRVREVTVDLRARDVRAQLAADVLPLDLDALSGRVFYRLQDGGYAVGARDLAFRTRGGLAAEAASFSLAVGRGADGVPHGEVRADGVDLKIAAALLDYLPVPREAKAQADLFAPRGRLLDTSLVWKGESPAAATALRLKSRFEELGFNAAEGFPGATGLSGSLEGDERGGRIRLASQGVAFEAAGIFRAPLAADTLDARATWARKGRAVEVRIEEARIASAGAEVTVSGTYRTLPDSPVKSPGEVDLAGRIERARATAVAAYLPDAIAETRDWLEGAVLAGELSGGRFELKGDLWNFPFREPGSGRFLAQAAIEGGRLQYHPAWPAVDRIKGDIRFENARMEIRAREAFIYTSRARSARAVIADLGAGPPVLEVEGDVDTTGVDSTRFLRETPLAEGPGAFTRTVAVEGPARLKLRLNFPLWGPSPARLAGEYAFSGATASVGRSLLLTGIRGTLAFTEKSVRAPELTGSMFGQPATLRLATQADGSVLTQLDGRMSAVALGAFIPSAFARRTAGAADWRARVVTGAESTELRVESDLKGLAVGLPEPFGKRADESRPVAVTIRRLGSADEEAVATLQGGVHARIGRAGPEGEGRWHVALKFGSPVAGEPVREGLWLYGDIGRFDLDAWHEALEAPAGSAPPEGVAAVEVRGLDVRFGTLRYTGRDIVQLEAKMRLEAGEWRGTLVSPLVAGDVAFDPRGRGRIKARLARFSLGTAQSGAAGPEPQPARGAEQDELPELDIVAERFDFRGRWLGRLELQARPDGREWRIDRLDITNGHARFGSAGAFRRTGTGPITQLDLKLETGDLHALLEQFGFGQFVDRGEARLEGTLVWPGYPYDFSTGLLSGRFKVQAAKGHFAQIEPGAGKLLGLMSLQSLPRRATLDFRDVFSEGFAFDRISGDVRLARGVLFTQDLEVAGPSAFVSMAGEVSLPLETQNLTIRVVPEVGESVAIAATFLGTPIMGLTTLVLSKLLQNPVGQAVAYEYLVTGSWDNPAVTRLGAPSPRPAAAGPPKAATPDRPQ
jgi:uncharacterized protein (TIGR02099 family)